MAAFVGGAKLPMVRSDRDRPTCPAALAEQRHRWAGPRYSAAIEPDQMQSEINCPDAKQRDPCATDIDSAGIACLKKV